MGRLRLLDVLRGVAIVGTLGTNIWLFAGVGDPIDLFAPKQWWASLDALIESLTLFLANGKFLSLLAILFGVGIEIQFQSARRRQRPWLRPYAWRTTLLLIEGLLHFLLVFEFDILVGYALAAYIVSLLVQGGRRTLLIAMGVSGTLHVLLFGLVATMMNQAIHDAPEMVISAALYLEGSYIEQVMHRLDHLAYYRSESIAVLPMNVFLFCLGALLMRTSLFAPTLDAARRRRRVFMIGLVLGVPLNLTLLSQNAGLIFLGRYLFAPFMALFYLGLFSILLERDRPLAPMNALAQIGRCALSCYILQNILSSVIFYGWGFGLKGTLNAGQTVLAWLGICLLLAIFAKAWMSWFERGPFEAIWRTLSQAPFRGR